MALFENKIKDAGAIALAEMLKTNTALKYLDLRANKIGVKGVVAFVKALMVRNSTMDLLEVDIADISVYRGAARQRGNYRNYQAPNVGVESRRAQSAPDWNDDDLTLNDDSVNIIGNTYPEKVSVVYPPYLFNGTAYFYHVDHKSAADNVLDAAFFEKTALTFLARNLLELIKANHADADVACNNLGTLVDRTNASSECICFSDNYFDAVGIADGGAEVSELGPELGSDKQYGGSDGGSGSGSEYEKHIPENVAQFMVDSVYSKQVMLNSSQYKISGPRCQYNHVTTCNGQGWLQDDFSCKCAKHVGDDCTGVRKSTRRANIFFGALFICAAVFYGIKHVSAYFRIKRQLIDQLRTFGHEHPFVVRTMAGDEYTLADWTMCSDLRVLLAKQHPVLGDFRMLVLQDANTNKIINPKKGSDDRMRMMFSSRQGCAPIKTSSCLVWCGTKSNAACSRGNARTATCCEDASIVEWGQDVGGSGQAWGKFELILTYDTMAVVNTVVSVKGNVVHNDSFAHKNLVGMGADKEI